MFSWSHGSKNSGGRAGGGALASHLFNRRLLAKAASSRAADSHPQSVGKTALGTRSAGGGRRQDACDDDPSRVQLVSVRRGSAERATAATAASVGVGAGRRRTKLGLSVAVVRGPSTMNDGGAAAEASSKSADVDDGQRELSVDIVDNHQDDSLSVASAPERRRRQALKDTGEYTPRRRDLYSISSCSQNVWFYHAGRCDEEMRRITEQSNLNTAIIQSRRLSIFGHIARMDDDDADAKSILTAPPPWNWKRPPGLPRITWLNTVQ